MMKQIKMYFLLSAFVFESLAMATTITQQGAKGSSDGLFLSLAKEYVADYQALGIPDFSPDYRTNFASIQDLKGVLKQSEVFSRYKNQIQSINPKALGYEIQHLHQQLSYEINLNIQRIQLELEFRHDTSTSEAEIPMDGLYRLPSHARWYGLYIKNSASKDISPANLMRFGKNEVARVTKEI